MSAMAAVIFCLCFAFFGQTVSARSPCLNSTIYKMKSVTLTDLSSNGGLWYYGGYTISQQLFRCDWRTFQVNNTDPTAGNTTYFGIHKVVNVDFKFRQVSEMKQTDVPGVFKFTIDSKRGEYGYFTFLTYGVNSHITGISCGPYSEHGHLTENNKEDPEKNAFAVLTKKRDETKEKINSYKVEAELQNPSMKFRNKFQYIDHNDCE